MGGRRTVKTVSIRAIGTGQDSGTRVRGGRPKDTGDDSGERVERNHPDHSEGGVGTILTGEGRRREGDFGRVSRDGGSSPGLSTEES